MTVLCYKVLDMSLTASIVIGVVLVLRLLLRKAPKVYSYALWSVVLFRLLCPVSVESGVSVIPSQVGYTPLEQSFEMQPGETGDAALHTVGDTVNGELGTIMVPLEPESTQTVGEGSSYSSPMHPEVWFLLFRFLWPTGVGLMAVYSLCSLFFLRRRLKRAVLLRDNIYWAEGIETAFVLGVLRPQIYLPVGLSREEIPYIICHEQHHIRRCDHIVKMLAFAALCVHWFNPLVWLAFVLAGKDMEMSCDEAVMGKMDGDIRADYAQSLLGLATGHRRIAATPLAFGEGDTKGRIQNVLKWKKPSVKVTVIAALVCVIAVALCISDPAKPVDTEKVERVVYEDLYLPKYVSNWSKQESREWEVQENQAEVLFGLLNKYTATWRAGLPGHEPLSIAGEDSVRLECDDGSYYRLSNWYFPDRPLQSTDEYDTTLAYYDVGGELKRCWTMEDNFDEAFHIWRVEQGKQDYFQKSTPFEQEEQAEPVQLTSEEVLRNAILEHHRSAYSDQYFCCESYIILDNEEGTRHNPITGEDLRTMHYYLWVLYQEYRFTEGGIVDEGGAHIPTVITLTENADGSWSVLNYWEPRDGSYYAEDIRAIFPGASEDEALHSQKYIMAQMQDCYAQAVAYAKTDSDVKMDVDKVIEGLFDVICSEPMTASDVYTYLEAHPVEHRELLYYGDYTRDYCIRQLQSDGDGIGLHRAIRELLLEELNP